jgi:hypothetical protein
MPEPQRAQGTNSPSVVTSEPTSTGWLGRACHMRRPHQLTERWLQTLATAGALVALASTACGSTSAADTSGPIPTPVTADSVRLALDNSTMKSAHFKVTGTLIVKGNYLPVTGDGIVQLRPREAFKINMNVQTYTSLGVLKMQAVTIGGRAYTKLGSGHWTSKPSTSSPTSITTYVGEETINGTPVWHARSGTKANTYDAWIRESDGYMVKISLAQATGNMSMTFDTYNKSPLIVKPA